jgi:hypothetical protein
VNLLGDSTSYRSFFEQFDAHNLSVMNMVEPTNFQSGISPSFLDLFLTNSPLEVYMTSILDEQVTFSTM